MCMQCMTGAELLITDVIPGYHVMRATKTADINQSRWAAGELGLVVSNDPMFVWPYQDVVDETYGMTDVAVEELSIDGTKWLSFINWSRYMEDIRDNFVCDPLDGYNLTMACVVNGCDLNEHNPVEWLVHKINTQLRQRAN